MRNKDIHDYSDIIDLPRPISRTHKPMSQIERAAQFAPFAALTGHKEAVKEKARHTQSKKLLDENILMLLDNQLQLIQEKIQKNPFAIITYFQEDLTKDGGQYITYSGHVKKIDEYDKRIVFIEGKTLMIDDIIDIQVE